MEQKWPSNVVLVRHGESLVNVEKERLREQPSEDLYIKTTLRDMSIPLTKKGEAQAKAAGKILKKYPKFDAVIVSPYKRAEQTARIILKELGYKPKIVSEERVREKDFGIMDKLTPKGERFFYPQEVERKSWDGKYYYRPPGGESYPDVALRVHSFFDTLIRNYKQKNVLIVTHSITILMFRKLLERLSEEEVLDIHENQRIENASISTFSYEEGKRKLSLKEWSKVK